MRLDSCPFSFGSVGASSFFSNVGKLGIEKPENLAVDVLDSFSSSSISGKSSSRAEKRPLPPPAPGLVARDEV